MQWVLNKTIQLKKVTYYTRIRIYGTMLMIVQCNISYFLFGRIRNWQVCTSSRIFGELLPGVRNFSLRLTAIKGEAL